MIANYHTHTPRCHHATGTEEEMILRALEAGVEELGFSDHAPQVFPERYVSRVRMRPWELPEYMHTLAQLREKYAHRLKLHIGLEAEYYPALFDDLMALVRSYQVEYLILGQHWLENEMDQVHVHHAFSEPKRLQQYCDQTITAMHTGVFTYIAHPDIANFTGEARVYEENMGRLIREAKACGLPLELNLHGARLGSSYPNRRFWELAAQEGAVAIMGRDAHEPEEFSDVATEQKILAMARELGLTVLERVKPVRP